MEEVKISARKGAKVNDDDRLALATLLIKLGYTVRIGKEKKENEKAYVTYVAFSE